jgi:predicted helicase
VGTVTSRDAFVIDSDKNKLSRKIEDFFLLSKEAIQAKYGLKENKSWKIEPTQTKAVAFSSAFIQPISYRPFDNRFIYYNALFLERPRKDVMQHFLFGVNNGLVFRRQSPEAMGLYVYISNNIIADGFIRSDNKGGESVAPLYQYPATDKQQSLSAVNKRTPNLDNRIVEAIASSLGLEFEPEKTGDAGKFAPIDLLDYIYAVLHSPTYRETYKELLKIDFPRIPYPKDANLFWRLVKLGGELRQIHLLESPTVENYITRYPADGDNIISRKITKTSPGFEPESDTHGKVWINDTQYFEGVPLIAWECYIGGYQPAQKWLKDRTGRKLSFDDILHYQKIIVALTETNRIMQEIDEVDLT